MFETESSWIGIALGFYVVAAAIGFHLAKTDRDSREDEDHLWYRDNLAPWTRPEYRRKLILAMTAFPGCVLCLAQIITVPFDLAPGSLPFMFDAFVRLLFSLGTTAMAFVSVLSIRKIGCNSVCVRRIRMTIAIVLLFALAVFPWISRSSQWYRLEIYVICTSFVAAAFVGLYIRRQQSEHQ